jgi:hypothetical protein
MCLIVIYPDARASCDMYMWICAQYLTKLQYMKAIAIMYDSKLFISVQSVDRVNFVARSMGLSCFNHGG